jgi:hypothetical protein
MGDSWLGGKDRSLERRYAALVDAAPPDEAVT